jgi:hypothetical protein
MNRGVWPTFSRFWIILEKNRGRKIVHFVEILGNEIHTFEEYILLFKFILLKNIYSCLNSYFLRKTYFYVPFTYLYKPFFFIVYVYQ